MYASSEQFQVKFTSRRQFFVMFSVSWQFQVKFTHWRQFIVMFTTIGQLPVKFTIRRQLSVEFTTRGQLSVKSTSRKKLLVKFMSWTLPWWNMIGNEYNTKLVHHINQQEPELVHHHDQHDHHEIEDKVNTISSSETDSRSIIDDSNGVVGRYVFSYLMGRGKIKGVFYMGKNRSKPWGLKRNQLNQSLQKLGIGRPAF